MGGVHSRDAQLWPRIARWISTRSPVAAQPLSEIGLRDAGDDTICPFVNEQAAEDDADGDDFIGGILLHIRGGDALLGTGGEELGLFDDARCGFVEPVAVAIWAGGHAGGDDGFTALTDFEPFGGGNDFSGAFGAVLEVVIHGWAGDFARM